MKKVESCTRNRQKNHSSYSLTFFVAEEPTECRAETTVYDAYPELKGDTLISLWSRCNYFLSRRAEERQGQKYFITLRESLVQDYGWKAEATLHTGGMEDGTEVVYTGYGLEAHEAMLVLFDVLKRDIPEAIR